jgi:hypothetical protein
MEELLKLAPIFAVAADATVEVVTVNVALVFVAGTITVPPAGTWAAAVLSLEIVTVSPPVAAAPVRVTVAVTLVPPVTLLLDSWTDATVGACTVNVLF